MLAVMPTSNSLPRYLAGLSLVRDLMNGSLPRAIEAYRLFVVRNAFLPPELSPRSDSKACYLSGPDSARSPSCGRLRIHQALLSLQGLKSDSPPGPWSQTKRANRFLRN